MISELPIINSLNFNDKIIKVKRVTINLIDSDRVMFYIEKLNNKRYIFSIDETEVFYGWDKIKINKNIDEVKLCAYHFYEEKLNKIK